MKTLLPFIVVIVLYATLFLLTWRLLIKPKPHKRAVLHATSSASPDKPTALMDRFVRRIAVSHTKRTGKYIPGTLGSSAVCKAILKDYGIIVSRAVRKHHARAYKIPRPVYI